MGLYGSTPAAPDYAAANREGIETDVETLPLRLMAEAAAREGKTLYKTADGRYTIGNAATPEPTGGDAFRSEYARQQAAGDTRTFDQWLSGHAAENPGDTDAQNYLSWLGQSGMQGTPYADFTGLGESDSLERDIAAQMQLLQGGADISRGLEKGRYEDLLTLLPQFNELNLQQQRDAYTAALEASDTGERQRLATELEYRPQFTQSELDAQRSALEQGIELAPSLNEAQIGGQADAYRRSLEEWSSANPEASQAKQQLVQALLAGVEGGTDLSPAQTRRVEQNMRKAQASRGNVLGPAAAFDEALAVSGYGEDLARTNRGELQNYLQSEQGLMPRFSAAGVPGFASGSYTPMVPNFQATTTSAPNLQPVQVTQSNPWSSTNPNAGAAGASWSQNLYQTQLENQQASPFSQILGLGMKAAGVAGGLGWSPFGP